MISFISTEGKKGVILFVHGFTGGAETWKPSNGKSFPELLLTNPVIKENYSVAQFEYYSKFSVVINQASNLFAQLQNLIFRSSQKRIRKISEISELSEMLNTEIKIRLQAYDVIIIIAHSMGGLVAKSLIVENLKTEMVSKVKLFITLATPHSGATLATYSNLISPNLQIKDMKPLADFLVGVNDAWLKAKARPVTKYIYGLSDTIVLKSSAVPIDKEKQDLYAVEEDHFSITKPANEHASVFKVVEDNILKFSPEATGLHLSSQSLESEAQYDDEIFVLKMLVADIHVASIKDAKEVFLNAEYMRKVFSADDDMKKVMHLYEKVRKLYKDEYTEFLHGGIANSGLLLSAVHKKITAEDRKFLHSLAENVNSIHKQGMLHQLANKMDVDIWWSKTADLALIEKKKAEINAKK